MAARDRSRRRFNIHVFAGLAAASACKHESAADAIPAHSVTTASAADVHIAMPEVPGAGHATAVSPVPNVAEPAVAGDGGGGLGLVGTGQTGGTGEGTIGLGNIGTLGGGRQGYGVSWASANRGGASDPIVRVAAPTVQGGLSQEVVRRVVLRQLGQIRHCFEQGLALNPNVSGRMVVRFVISPAGSVLSSAATQSTLANPMIETCVANAVSRWMFPSPEGGGIVTVSYPFTFRPPE